MVVCREGLRGAERLDAGAGVCRCGFGGAGALAWVWGVSKCVVGLVGALGWWARGCFGAVLGCCSDVSAVVEFQMDN